mmetsp:Transcript_6479/g.10285  ORF Transcript_6479/g.10285 Transcript_6479/m.10285 type:complete len:86 (+) Transcript_6479:2570-2827(+)
MCIFVSSIAPAQVYHVQQQDECRCISNILYTMLQRAVYYYCQPFEMTEFVTSMKEMRQTISRKVVLILMELETVSFGESRLSNNM